MEDTNYIKNATLANEAMKKFQEEYNKANNTEIEFKRPAFLAKLCEFIKKGNDE